MQRTLIHAYSSNPGRGWPASSSPFPTPTQCCRPFPPRPKAQGRRRQLVPAREPSPGPLGAEQGWHGGRPCRDCVRDRLQPDAITCDMSEKALCDLSILVPESDDRGAPGEARRPSQRACGWGPRSLRLSSRVEMAAAARSHEEKLLCNCGKPELGHALCPGRGHLEPGPPARTAGPAARMQSRRLQGLRRPLHCPSAQAWGPSLLGEPRPSLLGPRVSSPSWGLQDGLHLGTRVTTQVLPAPGLCGQRMSLGERRAHCPLQGIFIMARA